MAYNMYVALQDDDRILIMDMDEETGGLEAKGEAPIVGGPSALALSPNRDNLYVGHRNTNELSSFSVDRASGALTLLGTIPLEASPTYLSPDRQGRFLLSSHYQGARVGVHAIGADGAVSLPPVEWITTENGAHSILVDRSNRYAFVPHIARIADNVMQPPGDNLGPNAIYQFKFDAATGKLTPNSPAVIKMTEFLGPATTASTPPRTSFTSPTSRVAALAGTQWTPTRVRWRRCRPFHHCPTTSPAGTPAP